MSDLAIKIEHLSKRYQLGVINTGTFFRDMQTLMARKRGKPDPHAKIGQEFCDGPDSFWALKDVCLDIHEGERIGIIGKNGAGKSTLLKLISQISSPTEGSIKIKGKVTSLLEVGTGFNGELTGRENIYLNGAILGMKKRQIDKVLDEIIDFSGIEKHIDTPAKRYSSGMYVRLAFAVAAHLDSDILIADEVLAVGDASFQKKAIGKMNDVSSSQGRTVLFVSHQMNFISQLCPTCAIMDKGRILYRGPTSEGIPRYLEIGAGKATQLSYANNIRKPVMITGFTLVNESGDTCTQSTIHAPLFAKIQYSVNQPIEGAYIALHILGPEEQNLVDSCDVDTNESLFKQRLPGEYEATIAIPTNLLNAGRFYIEAWTGKPSESTDYFKTEKIGLDIIDTGTEISKFNKTRGCLLSPVLEWKTRKTEDYSI